MGIKSNLSLHVFNVLVNLLIDSKSHAGTILSGSNQCELMPENEHYTSEGVGGRVRNLFSWLTLAKPQIWYFNNSMKASPG